MPLQQWLSAWATIVQRPTLPPVANAVPITALVPSKPFEVSKLPAVPPHPDLPLIMREFHVHKRNFPQLTWAEFVKILEHREQFFGEERREREAKLAKLNSITKFKL